MKLGGVVLGLLMLSTTAQAAVSFDSQGRLIMSGPYEGPGFTTTDAAAIAGIATGSLLFYNYQHPMSGLGFLATTSLAYGAWRTAKYRPQASKDAIHAALNAKCEELKGPGHAPSILNPTGC